MPWNYERIVEDGIEYIDAFHTDNPEEKHRVYKFLQDQLLIEFYPKKADGFPLKKIILEGFSFPPKEFAEAGYIRGGGIKYYLSTKITEKNVCSLIISNTQEDSMRKVRNRDAYRMVLSYSSFKQITKSLTSISYVAKQDRRASVDGYFNSIFPNHYKKYTQSGRNRAVRLVSHLDENVIEFLKPNDIMKLLNFIKTMLNKRYKNKTYRHKLFSSAKIRVDNIALSDVINTFEKLLDDNPKESVWGEFIRKNLFLVESKYINIIPELNVVLGTTRKVDFGLVDSQGFLDLFEIKKPSTTLLAKKQDRGNFYWSTDAIKALVQAEKYLHNAERKASSLAEDIKREFNIEVKIIRPRAVVIIGHSNQLDKEVKKQDFRILRQSLKNVEVVLYDELLERLKNQRKKVYVDTSKVK